MGLRSRVSSSNCDWSRVSQRLKRRPTIIDKLTREPNMQLTTMQDIGGCRAVLPRVDDVQAVRKRWLKGKDRVVRVYDYYATPKPSGYRGLHIVVQYDGFLVEVQLRTQLQHAWGVAIERLGPKIGHDLKSGEGPGEILHLFRVFGDMLAQVEGLPVEAFDWTDFESATQAVDLEILSLIGLELREDGVTIAMPH